MHHHPRVQLSNIQIDMIAGICAGVISNLVSHPLDTIKVRMQLKTGEPLKLVPTIQEMFHREGVRLSLTG